MAARLNAEATLNGGVSAAASVWTTINGYGYVTWNAIEGSPYEL
jgi:hypothetical protein